MILLERHTKKSATSWNNNWTSCDCSYCKSGTTSNKLHYGLNIPEDKSWNSWWVIKFWPATYLRFTLPFLKRKK